MEPSHTKRSESVEPNSGRSRLSRRAVLGGVAAVGVGAAGAAAAAAPFVATDRGFVVVEDGSPRLLPTLDGRAVNVENLQWQSGRPFGYGNKDFVFGAPGFVDYSGLPTYDGLQRSYTKIFGATVEKRGPGNVDTFWASGHGYGPDEIGLLIGDMTQHNGGNAWGFDVRAQSDTADATLIGGYIGVKPGATRTVTTNGVAGTALTNTVLQAPTRVGDVSVSCAANPGVGRFTIGTGPSLDYVSILSVTDSAPYIATLSTPVAYAHAEGSELTIHQTTVLGLRIRNFANNPADVGIVIDSAASTIGGWADYIRVFDTSGSTTPVFHVGSNGLTRTGPLYSYANGSHDLGTVENRWRALHVNSVAVNGATAAGSSGAIQLKNAAINPTSIPLDGTVLYGVEGRLMATGGIGAWTNVDGASVLRLQTDRPWSFKQVGTGEATALRLVSDVSDKQFSIGAPDGNSAFSVQVSDSALNQSVEILPTVGGRLGFHGAAPIAQPTRVGQIIDNSGGSNNGSAIGPITDLESAMDAIATLAAKVNALESMLSASAGGYGLTL